MPIKSFSIFRHNYVLEVHLAHFPKRPKIKANIDIDCHTISPESLKRRQGENMDSNKSLVGKGLEIFYLKLDNKVKVGSLILENENLDSEANCIRVLQKAMESSEAGPYAVHLDHALFASFHVESNKINSLHRRSLSTGAVLPCWSYFG